MSTAGTAAVGSSRQVTLVPRKVAPSTAAVVPTAAQTAVSAQPPAADGAPDPDPAGGGTAPDPWSLYASRVRAYAAARLTAETRGITPPLSPRTARIRIELGSGGPRAVLASPSGSSHWDRAALAAVTDALRALRAPEGAPEGARVLPITWSR